MGAIAPCATHIHQMRHADIHLSGELTHHCCCSRNLGGGLNLDPQGGQHTRNLNRRGIARHDRAHDVDHFFVGEVLMGDNPIQGLGNGEGHTGSSGSVKVTDDPGNSSAWHGHARSKSIQDEIGRHGLQAFDAAGP